MHPTILITLLLGLLCCSPSAVAIGPWSRRGGGKDDGNTPAARSLVDESIGRSLPKEDTVPAAASFDEFAASAGHFHTCALSARPGLTKAGTVRCFGHNSHGQTEAPPGIYSQVTSGHAHSCAVSVNGKVSCWGNIPPPPEYKSFAQVSSGGDHACGVQSMGGTVLCWGSNHHGESDPPPSGRGAAPFVQVSSGQSYSCGLRRDAGSSAGVRITRDRPAPPRASSFAKSAPGSTITCAASPPTRATSAAGDATPAARPRIASTAGRTCRCRPGGDRPAPSGRTRWDWSAGAGRRPSPSRT